MNKKDFDKLKLPEFSGVYLFKKGKDLLYVGKATNLRSRVRSYFGNELIKTRGRLLVDMVSISDTIEFQKTDSVLEALILEAELIKKNQPKYNTKDKDNKSYNYVVITDEDFPRVLVVRGRNLEQKSADEKDIKYKYTFGPYPYGGELKEALKLVRKIFPFRDKCVPFTDPSSSGKPCFNRTIGLCPGVCSGEISKKDYGVQIKNIKTFFEGHKPKLLKNLEKEMMVFAKKKEFEKAHEIKKTIFALNHIQDVSLIKNNSEFSADSAGSSGHLDSPIKIEAYDIAHLSGKNMVGAVVVMENGELQKNSYRKFIIKNFEKANDSGALEEVIKRRMNHTEWATPNIVVLDGNDVQLKRAHKTWGNDSILFCSVVKDKSHKAKDILFYKKENWTSALKKFGVSEKVLKEQIVKINAEAHRFVTAFHKNRRARDFLQK